MRNAPTNQSNPRQEVDGSLEAPLLGDAAHNGGESSYGSIDDGSRPDTQSQRPEITRLPLGQISLLAYMRIATPLVDTQSLPVCTSRRFLSAPADACFLVHQRGIA